MRINKHQTTICIILTTFILLLGMCFDCSQTDSFFSCYSVGLSGTHNGQASFAIETADTVSILNQICSGQVIGRQSSATIQQQTTRRSFSTKTGKGHGFAYLLMYILPLLLSSVLLSEFYDFMPDIRKTSIIIRYIQHKDGKKPQLSF